MLQIDLFPLKEITYKSITCSLIITIKFYAQLQRLCLCVLVLTWHITGCVTFIIIWVLQNFIYINNFIFMSVFSWLCCLIYKQHEAACVLIPRWCWRWLSIRIHIVFFDQILTSWLASIVTWSVVYQSFFKATRTLILCVAVHL